MNEIKKLTEEIKKLSRAKETFKKKKKRTSGEVNKLDRENSKKRGKYRHFKKREITIKFI